MNNFEQIKKINSVHEMANRITFIVRSLSLNDVDESLINLLILGHLQEETTDF